MREDAQGTADALTSIGLETDGVEEVESIKGGLRGVVIGKVLTCEAHPNSDHLHITTVDLGDGKGTQIVCGAPNVAAGQTVVVATVGTTLYDGDKAFEIKKSKIRGVESMGMICAEDEIGVGKSHEGIIVIPEGGETPKAGTPAAEYYKLTSDYRMEVDLTPNRIDAASHYGVARDLAAYLAHQGIDGKLHRPSVESFKVDEPGAEGVKVWVEDHEGAPRYSGLTIKGVKVGPSPEWLQERLQAIGMHPINNVVDITNYILHGFCQPLHCFDVSKIAGGEIVVRTCAAGTKFQTLDGEERELSEADLMICDAEKPMCIAGVFGGLDSGVTEATTDIFLESACFNATRIRRTARRHGMSTDASFRFERGVDPNGTMYALKLAALMVQQLAGGKICGDVVDIYPEPVEPYRVRLSYSYLCGLIGKEIPKAEIDAILGSLEIKVTPTEDADVVELEVSTYRMDVRRPCDVVEEVLRIYGYNNVDYSTTVHSSLQFKSSTDSGDDLRREVSEQLTGEGFNEILNNSLTTRRYYEALSSYPGERCIGLMNPLSGDLGVMRQSLLFGGLETIARNVNRRSADLALYEFGNVYRLNPEVEATKEAPLAPYSEEARLALWMTGNYGEASWQGPAREATFYHLKGVVGNILRRMGIGAEQYTMEQEEAMGDIFRAQLTVKTRSGKPLGHLGILSESVLQTADLRQSVSYAEMDWEALTRMAERQKTTFTPLAKTQDVRRDLALLLDNEVSFSQVESAIRKAAGKLLRRTWLFDVYEGKNLAAGKKSYAVALLLGDDERTLQERQIDAVMQRVIQALTRELKAELR